MHVHIIFLIAAHVCRFYRKFEECVRFGFVKQVSSRDRAPVGIFCQIEVEDSEPAVCIRIGVIGEILEQTRAQ